MFQTGRVIRGNVGEPVAVETSLGWVLSGPLKSRQEVGSQSVAQVNHVTRDQSIDNEINKLWSLELLGITESNEVHEEFVF